MAIRHSQSFTLVSTDRNTTHSEARKQNYGPVFHNQIKGGQQWQGSFLAEKGGKKKKERKKSKPFSLREGCKKSPEIASFGRKDSFSDPLSLSLKHFFKESSNLKDITRILPHPSTFLTNFYEGCSCPQMLVLMGIRENSRTRGCQHTREGGPFIHSFHPFKYRDERPKNWYYPQEGSENLSANHTHSGTWISSC